MNNPRTMLPPGECAPRNVYAIFRAAMPGGSRFRVWARDFYEFVLDGGIAGHGPVKSAAPLWYFDEYTLPEGGEHTVEFKVHRRDGDAEFWSDAPVEWRARRIHEYADDAPRNIGETGFSEFVDFDAPRDEFAPVRPGEEFPKEWLRARPIPPFVEKRLEPLQFGRDGDRVIADFGGMVYGRIDIAGHGRDKGGAAVVSYIEDFGRGWAHGEGREAMYFDTFGGGGAGAYRFRSFGKRGFRYAAISGDFGTVDSVCVHTCAGETPELGRFTCSDSRLNRLWEISRATVAICLDDIINDCPHRDQAQWMDAFVSSKCAFSLFGDSALAAKCLLQHALCSFREGKIYSPSICGSSDMPDYALVLWMFMRDYYRQTGDLETLRECYPNCRTSLQNLRGFQDSDHLLKDRRGAYLDNTFELCRLGKSAALNALFYGALNAAAEIAALLGDDAAGDEYRREAKLVHESFRRVFVADGMVRDSDSRPEDGWRCLNFSCEFDERWSGKRARAVFHFASEPGELRIRSAAYGPYRVIFNGATVADDRTAADWGRPFPAYAPRETTVATRAENELIFEVDCNPLNWELYFSLPGVELPECELEEIDPETLAVTLPRRTVRPRPWFPPRISQTTCGYAGYCGLLTPSELKNSLTEQYYRNYIGIRTPRFSTETADPGLLAGWVMPPNTPWTMFYYLSALFASGLETEALALLRRAWGVMLDAGAVNTFEEWGSNASLCHAWGGTPVRFMLREILGIDDGEIFRKHLVIRPNLFDLDFAVGAAAVSGTETVAVELRRENGHTGYRITVPDGFTAEIDLSRLENPLEIPAKE